MNSPPTAIQQRRRYAVEWGVFAAAFLLMGVLAGYTLFQAHAETEKLESDRLQVQARVVSVNLLRQFEGVDRALVGVRNDFFSGAANGPGVPVMKSRRLKALVDAIPGMRAMLVLDAQGRVIAANQPELVGRDFSGREYFTTPRSRPEPELLFVSKPFQSLAGVRVVNLTRVLHDERGAFAGIVTAGLDPDYFNVVLGSVLYAPDMRIALVHGTGTVFLTMPPNPATLGMQLDKPGSFFALHRESGRDDTLFSGKTLATGEERMVATRTVRQGSLQIDRPMVVHVSRMLDAIYAAWYRQVLVLSAALIGAMAASAATLGFLQKRRREFEALASQTQKDREERNRRIRAVTDNLPVLLAYVDAEQRYRFANAHFRTLLGVEPDSLVGKTVLDTVGESTYAALKPHIEAALSGQVQHFERHRVASGQDLHLLLDYIPDFEADGRVAGFHVLVLDITARKRAELQQAESEARVKSILTQAPDAFISIDAGSRITEWNRRAEITFGWKREEVMGRSLSEVLIPPEHRSAHDSGMARFARTGTGAVVNQRLELMALHKDGRTIPVELSVGAVQQGDSYTAIAFLHDISERRATQDAIRHSEKLLRDITDSVPALIAYCDADERCRFINTPAFRILKLEPGDPSRYTLRQALGESSYALHEPHIKMVLQGKRVSFEARSVHTGPDAFFMAHLVPDKREDGSVRGFYIMTFDVTQMKNAELERAAAEKLIRAVTDNLPVMISYIDAQQHVRFLNATFQTWTGLKLSSAIGKPLIEVIGPQLYEQRRGYLQRSLAGERVQFDLEWFAFGADRSLHNVYVPDVLDDGQVAGVFTLSSDVTALKRVERKLLAMARFDSLTGLANRHQFDEKLAEALSRAERTGQGLGLMFLDVDRFKAINDSLGHAGGDAVLKEFALRVQLAVRTTDCVARLAGDEFVVILENLHDAAELQPIARKVLAQFERPFEVGGRPWPVSASIGIAFHRVGTISPPDLLARADRALYQAKAAGRNTFRLADSLA